MDQLTERIGSGLVSSLPGFEWLSSKFQLRRCTSEGWIGISIEVLPTSNRDIAKLAAHGQVRNDDIEVLYTPFNAHLTKTDAKDHATITINCDSLLKNTPLVHGFRIDDSSVEQFIVEYGRELRDKIVPWLEKHLAERALFDGLSSDNPRDWITSDRLTRFPVLLAILSRRGDWTAFERVAEEFLNYCKKPHGLVHKEYAEAMTAGLRELCS